MRTAPRRIVGPDWLVRFLRKLGIDGPDWQGRGGAISPTDLRSHGGIIGSPDRPAGLGEQVLSITPDSALASQIFGLTGPYSYRAADGTIVSCWYSPATGWFCPNAVPVVSYPWWWGWGGGGYYGHRRGNWFRGSGGGGHWGGHGGGHHHGGHHGLGATWEDALTPKTPLGWAYRIFSIVGALTGAYHGYKRNNSIGWAIGWGILGGAFPFATVPISIAQGFGKKKNRSRRRNAVKLRPGQRWQRGSGELWKACTSCAEAMGPFQYNLDGPDICAACEAAPTGQYRAARRQNRKGQGHYYFFARGFAAGRRGTAPTGVAELTAAQRRSYEEGYAAGVATPALAATQVAGRRTNVSARRVLPPGTRVWVQGTSNIFGGKRHYPLMKPQLGTVISQGRGGLRVMEDRFLHADGTPNLKKVTHTHPASVTVVGTRGSSWRGGAAYPAEMEQRAADWEKYGSDTRWLRQRGFQESK